MLYGGLVKIKKTNMKLKLFFFLALLAITSCSNNNDDEIIESVVVNKPKPNKISSRFPILAPSISGNDPNCYFEYDLQGRPTKKIGGVLQMSGGTGFGSYFLKSIYTAVSYNENAASIGTYSSDPDFSVQVKGRSFEFDHQGKIIKSVILQPQYEPIWEKHLSYNYDNTGKLVEILTELPNMPYDPTDPIDYILSYAERFTYDNSGNLQKAVTVERRNSIDAYIIKKIEFSNFDAVQNPFTSLGIFEEYFYFSLSNNTPQRMKIQEFNEGGQLGSYSESTWTNQYDSNGSLKLFY